MRAIYRKRVVEDDHKTVVTTKFLGIPIFRGVYIDRTDDKTRPIGFNVMPSEAPTFYEEEDDYLPEEET